jgi:hypothetical protein
MIAFNVIEIIKEMESEDKEESGNDIDNGPNARPLAVRAHIEGWVSKRF